MIEARHSRPYSVQIDGAVIADPSTHTYLRFGLAEQCDRSASARRRLLRASGCPTRPRGPDEVVWRPTKNAVSNRGTLEV